MNSFLLEPNDKHNQTLLKLVHPSDWKNPKPAKKYNLVVIGAGTAGLVAAGGAAAIGAKVALIEKHLLGGDCLNFGCVPSKAVIRAARTAYDVRTGNIFGIHSQQIDIDFAFAMERMRRLRAAISHHDSAESLRQQNIDVFIGEGRFVDRKSIEVGGECLSFKKALIATGARAARPPIPGLNKAGFLTNETVFSLTSLPSHLAVIGGGPIGCELAQAFTRLGAKVSIIQSAPQLLPREDGDAAAILTRVFEEEGITIMAGSTLKKVEANGEKKILHIETEKGSKTITVDAILVGVGRTPNLDGLDLEKAGVTYNKKGVVVNDFLQTTNPAIYAAGDICMAYKFTHAADAAARLVVQNALFLRTGKLSTQTIPWCTYTDPEIAHVGLSEKQAQTTNIPVQTFCKPLDGVDRAILDGETNGFVKLIVSPKQSKILGATIVARHAGDMIGELVLAVKKGLHASDLAAVIHPYPTQAEAVRKAASEHYASLLKPWVSTLFQKWFAFGRK